MKWIDRSEIAKRLPYTAGGSPIAGYVCARNRWVVQVFPVPSVDGTSWEGLLRVGIKLHDKRGRGREIIGNWSRIQEIKEDLFPGRLAIEVYPPSEQVVDVAPLRWLWVFPEGCKLPFSLSNQVPFVGG